MCRQGRIDRLAHLGITGHMAAGQNVPVLARHEDGTRAFAAHVLAPDDQRDLDLGRRLGSQLDLQQLITFPIRRIRHTRRTHRGQSA
jgi:hypothetical protein